MIGLHTDWHRNECTEWHRNEYTIAGAKLHDYVQETLVRRSRRSSASWLLSIVCETRPHQDEEVHFRSTMFKL